MLKRILIVPIGLILSSCGGDKAPKESENEATPAPKIEVVANSNAKEIKVKEKISDENQSKSFYLKYDIKSNYDENSQPANHDASVRVKPRTKIDAELNIRSPYEEVKISMMVKKLSKKFIVKCSACHNDYANGIIGPSLLSKTNDEIMRNIADFKSGKKSNPLMKDLIKMMSDKEIKELADEIYQFNQKIKELGK
ncbi:FIG01282305: hypothetical protein [hydrothermal vent metagenome]|uniref:Cytochrome c domain-containing protein n=1 Tax=hydrothermal vent metagenome TaxID=652676 RepID=A0A1W1EKY0_9ZZZZ